MDDNFDMIKINTKIISFPANPKKNNDSKISSSSLMILVKSSQRILRDPSISDFSCMTYRLTYFIDESS